MSSQREKKSFEYVKYLWQDEVADQLSGLDRLVYRSNKLGEDLTLTNTGGGNTSAKLVERDPLTGQEVEVLWVKGSGGDLRTAQRDGFASFYLDKIRAMKPIYLNHPENGPKTKIEDAMYPMYSHCVFNLNPRAGSIDTPLHTLVPYRHVDHLHPNAVIAIAASVNQERLTKEIYGDEIIYIPWQRPGFDIGLKIEELIRQNPQARGILLGHHGMSSWSNDDKTCYETALEIIDRAARYIESKDRGEETFGGRKHEPLAEADRRRLIAEINPFFVDWDPATGDIESLKKAVADGIVEYREDYAAYYDRCKHPDSPAMRDPNPTVVLIPGLVMLAWGKNKSESRVTAEFYNCAIEVMRGAEAIDEYEAMDQQEAFDIEYWLLEEAKLRRMPPEKELDRQVIVIIGAGAGIGKETAHRLVREGAHIVCVDLDEAAAKETAQEIVAKYGPGIGVAGTGISNCGPAIGLSCDITNRESVAR